MVSEYTARDTPKQNSLVEVAFYAFANKVCATMHHANLHMEMRYQLYVDRLTIIIELNGKLTENAPRHFQRLLAYGCSENVSNTALTIVCTINVNIDCNGFQVPNPNGRKIILD